MKISSRIISLFSISMLAASTALSASVAQVKESKLLINLDGSAMSTGEEFFVLNDAGKKVGLARIKAIKGEKALAELIKGKAAPGMAVQAKAAPAVSQETSTETATNTTESGEAEAAQDSTETSSKKSSKTKSKKHIGGVSLGYAMNSMSLTAQYGTTKNDVTMTDSGFLVKGFYDYDLTKRLVVRFSTGLQMFNVKGTTAASICENGASKSCEVSFTYLVGEANANYYLTDGNFKTWAGFGFTFLLAAAKKNNIPNLSSDTSTNQMLTVGLGADWWISKSSFIPFSVHYGMFPGSTNVKASSTIVQAGYGFNF